MRVHPPTAHSPRAACSAAGRTCRESFARSRQARAARTQAQASGSSRRGTRAPAIGRRSRRVLQRNVDDPQRVLVLEKAARARRVEARIARANAQEKAVARGEVEIGRVEDRVVEPGQSVQRPQAEEDRKRCAEHGELERRRDECGPAIERPPTRVDRVVDYGAVPLQEIRAQAARDAAQECDQRHAVFSEGERLRQAVHRVRRVRIHVVVFATAMPRRLDQRVRLLEASAEISGATVISSRKARWT